MIYQRAFNRGIRLGSLFDRARRRNPASTITLDHDLDLAPDLGRRLTMAAAQTLVEDFSARLWAAGLRTGDHLVIYKSNNFDITLTACAAARLGIVPVLLSPKLDPAVALVLLQRLGRPFLLTDASKLSSVAFATAPQHAAAVLTVGGRTEESIDFLGLSGAPAVAAVDLSPDHPTLITHTSGTTGIPKLAVHTGRTMEARYRPQSMVARGVRPRETVAIHVSFVHSRIFTALPIAVLHGHSVVMMLHDDPASVAPLFAQTRPGLIEAHPNTFVAWELLERDPRRPLANVRVFSSTFDAIHPRTVELMLRASQRRKAVFVQMYGQSEVGPIAGRIYSRRRGMPEGRCVGWSFPLSTAIRVVPRGGVAPDRDHPGYIEVKSDGQIITYFGEQARWEQQVHDGWWRMGDVGFTTRLGCLHMQDREIDLVAGIPSTLELEDRLLRMLPNLQEIVVVEVDGVATPVIATRDGELVPDEIWDEAMSGLPPLGPRVQLAPEDMPQTSTTKIRRVELTAQLTARSVGSEPAPASLRGSKHPR